jgi:hypothetical protein
MKKLLWTLQLLLAFAFAGSGSMKLFKSGSELRADPRMGWANDFSDEQIMLIGGAEVVGAVGLVVPAATGIATVLTPVAAVSLATVMGGAVATHVRRGEPPVAPAVLGLLALTVAALRFRRSRARETATS